MSSMLRARNSPDGRAPVTAALVVITGVGPLAVDTYLAALPELQRSLHTSAAIAQLTVTAFIIGLAAGQLTLGPLSDALGRRRLLLAGAFAFALMSLLCALAPNGPLLVAGRLVQGLAAGCGVAIGRAIVGDVYSGDEAAKRYGTLAAINFLGPVIAPALGGAVLTVGTWRTIFAALAGFGLIMLATVNFGIPETLPPGDRHGSGLSTTGARMLDLLRDRLFTRPVVIQCLATAGFFVYIGGGSFVLETVYGVSETQYAGIFATNAAAMALTSLLFRVLVDRGGVARLRTVGVLIGTTASIGLVVIGVLERQSLPPLVLPWILLCSVTAAMGLVIPATTALAQEAGRRARGTASALQGGLSFFVGALVTPLTGIVGYRSMLPMALLMAGFFLCASAYLLLTRPRSSPPPPP
jgi:MFS transporter, DHA1 family, multidrug resistance protein